MASPPRTSHLSVKMAAPSLAPSRPNRPPAAVPMATGAVPMATSPAPSRVAASDVTLRRPTRAGADGVVVVAVAARGECGGIGGVSVVPEGNCVSLRFSRSEAGI